MARISSISGGGSTNPRATVGVFSYGTKGNVIPKVQFDFDVTKFRDPTGQKQFKGTNGISPDVRDWVGEDERVWAVIQDCLLLADDLVKPKSQSTGGVKMEVAPVSGWLSFAFHDYHGKWAGPAVAELVAEALSKAGYVVATTHYGLKTKSGEPVVL